MSSLLATYIMMIMGDIAVSASSSGEYSGAKYGFNGCDIAATLLGQAMSRLKEINDEIYRRWEAGENHIDLANEFNRNQFNLRRLLKNRQIDKELGPYVPGPSNKERHAIHHERNAKIAAARTNRTATYEALAREFGLSPERIRQIWMRYLRDIGDKRGFYGPRLWARMQRQRDIATHGPQCDARRQKR